MVGEVEEGRVVQFKQFMGSVRLEMRKIVWPTREETTNTTMVVLGMVILLSLFMWVVDSILAVLIKTIVSG